MKSLIATLAISFAAIAAPSRADEGGGCHFHGSKPATADTVSGCATLRKAQLVKQGKLDATWASVKGGAPEQVDGKKGKEWKVTFQNPAATDKAKQTLYMFYTLPGNFIAANFTGQ
ncbi:MAG: DUF6488 family protein [Piscinibacter sp.]